MDARRTDHTAIVGCDLFVDGVAVESPGSGADLDRLHERAREHGGFVWLGLHEPTEAALTRVAEVFGLHPLAVEDVLHREQRVKFERYEEVSFLVVRAARYVEHHRLTAGFVRVFVGPQFVITVGQGSVMEQVHGFDEVVNALLQARLTQVSVDQNNDMRKIASWAAIAAVPTVIGGVYGMNFATMPELAWRFGYHGAMLLILLGAATLYWLLRRAGWL
ncbi:hypothetical protein GCM10010168_78880 [Actinoplanes ianthinogenes]|uniref:Uncharacterized protein n=1 Tax=Actinoplanes ianthinogenes TaxID=122358 RepID=A0ABM7LK71_9ACTN|nr:CorA family divalent cation transporter [Actinoplanes ianthinogenes]BCJ39657.1 hypothetical protein Aiant_03140 [Actinoplanes ianthinogenes]GGR48294.1 hypothetical protein GCM10010168_78880 [Actinoplanes ianthinogenes]